MTDRSDRAGAIAFVVVLVILAAAILVMLWLDPGDLRAATAGFVGGVVAVLCVGVSRWIGGGKKAG